MQEQLEILEKTYSIEWFEYEVGKLFKIGTGSLINTKDAKPGLTPRISVKTTNNGIIGYYDENVENARYFDNFISINFFGKAYYHPYRASVEMRVHTLKMYEHELTREEGIFLSAVLNKRFSSSYSYGNQLSSSKLKNEGFKIQLPTCLKNGKRLISFDFIKDFIITMECEYKDTLKVERENKLEAYLSATDLKNYQLTATEEKNLNSLNTIKWKEFRIEDILIWQKNISEINPLHLNKLSISNEKKYPFYGRSTNNRGIIEYLHLNDEVLNNKLGQPTILIHSNNQNIVYLDTPFYLKDGHGATSVLQANYLNKVTAQFLIAAIKKVISQKYTYNAKATKIELKKTIINLPIKSDDTPDYEYMSLVILAMQKIVIQKNIKHVDDKIKKIEQLLS